MEVFGLILAIIGADTVAVGVVKFIEYLEGQ